MRFPYKGAGIALIYSDSEDYILLGLRSDHPFHKRWSVPGGYYDKNKDKNVIDNAEREFNEETGLFIDKIEKKYITSWKIRLPFFEWHTFIYSVNSKIDGLNPNEFFELKWLKIKDLKNYKLRPFTKKEISTFYKARH